MGVVYLPYLTMRSLAIILAVVGVSFASEAGFLNFAKTFNKKYGSTEEYNKRRAIFLENYADMVRHNQEYEEGKVSWWRKVTEHYDLTAEEREIALNLGLAPVNREEMTNSVDPLMEERIQARSAPASWSWKDQGGVTSVKNQASCGSCAVFASVAAIDTCFWQVTGRLVDDLSEQHVMDCGYGYGNAGCDGGFMVSYMEWIKDENDGFVEMESCDPYPAPDGFCTDDDSCNYGAAKVTGVYSSWSPNEPDMKEMVYLRRRQVLRGSQRMRRQPRSGCCRVREWGRQGLLADQELLGHQLGRERVHQVQERNRSLCRGNRPCGPALLRGGLNYFLKIFLEI